jgi:hypothetical protein
MTYPAVCSIVPILNFCYEAYEITCVRTIMSVCELSSIECDVFYAVRAVSKENWRLLIPKTLYFTYSLSDSLKKTLLKRHG